MNNKIKLYLDSIGQTTYEIKRGLQIGLREEIFNDLIKATKLSDEEINTFLDDLQNHNLQLVTVNDDEENVLTTVCKDIPNEEIEQSITELREMVNIMRDNDGCGLAANQVGLLKRMFIYEDIKGHVQFVINPKIISVSNSKKVSMTEGCLSYPGVKRLVPRYKTILVTYFNGITQVKKRLMNYEARVFQHEITHLTGSCILGEEE